MTDHPVNIELDLEHDNARMFVERMKFENDPMEIMRKTYQWIKNRSDELCQEDRECTIPNYTDAAMNELWTELFNTP